MRDILDFVTYWWIVFMAILGIVCLFLSISGVLDRWIDTRQKCEEWRADIWIGRWIRRSALYARIAGSKQVTGGFHDSTNSAV